MQSHAKLILVGGNVAKQTQHLHTPVYFDQGGRLVQHLGIRHTPAVVTQQGERLLIRELIPLCSKTDNKREQAAALPP